MAGDLINKPLGTIGRCQNNSMKLPFALCRPILAGMTELDQVWSQMLTDAASKAAATGRRHVAEYLRLRATNDAIRKAGIAWLLDSLIEIGLAARTLPTIAIERVEPHSFQHGASNMVGSLIKFRYGVRCLSIEAGWTRTPSDGVMRQGALAFARILHFGAPRAGAELRLVRTDELPSWIDDNNAVIETDALRRHFAYFLGI